MAVNTTHSNNTIKTRIQLKSDTEENWKKSVLVSEGGVKTSGTSFVPLAGELIVYTSDATHLFSRLKVGNGVDNVVNLPFIDAGTISGEEVEIVKLEHYSDRPLVGSSDKLYIDLETNTIYHYASGNGYTQLSNFTYAPVKTLIKKIVNWGQGKMTRAQVYDNQLKIENGGEPYLNLQDMYVVTDIQKEGQE